MKWIKIKSAVGTHKAGDLIEVTEEVAKAYIEAGIAEDGETAAKDALNNLGLADVQASLKGFTEAFKKSFDDAVDDIKKSGTGRGAIEAGAQQADKTKSVGDFVKTMVKAHDVRDLGGMQAAQDRLKKAYGSVEKGMEEATGSSGGFWTMPTEFSSTILELASEDAVIMPGSTNVPLGARSMEWPALDQYQVPKPGQSAMYGGVTVSRKSETAKRDQTQPSAKKVKLEANDLTAMTEYSRDLNDDSASSLSAMLTKLIGGAIGWRRDWEHFWGTGEGQCLGFMQSPALMRFKRKTAGGLDYTDLSKMKSRLLPQSRKKAVWIAHTYLEELLLNLTDPSGRLIFIPTMTTNEGPISTNPINNGSGTGRLLSLPILFTEKAKAPGQLGDLTLVDRSCYLTGQRSGLEIGLSEHFLFDSDQIALRAKIRDDGQPWVLKPITLADGSGTNQASPFLALDTPAGTAGAPGVMGN